MPNIMLTYRCNLHCPYCFANEFVNKEKTDITLGNFLQAVSFMTRAEPTRIGLIGGEPTIHPGFGTFMDLLAAHPRVYGVTVYTNGLLTDRWIPQLTRKTVKLLVNVNSPLVIGEKAFDTIRRNLDALIFEQGMKEQIRLGINLYSNDMDYTYIMDLLRRYDYHRVRFSLTVPDFSAGGETDALGYFNARKAFLMEFLRKMDSIQVMAFFDCNRPPYCFWTEEEKEWLEAYIARYPDSNTNLIGRHTACKPVIDILPNLQAVRCFGMSDFIKVPISDFRSLTDLGSYFVNEIDSMAYKLPACEKCAGCYEQKTLKCVTGCMGFKASGIHAANDAVKKL